jgi:hypothetical protein
MQTKPSNVMGAATGFHGDNARWQLRQKIQKPETLHTVAHHDSTSAIYPSHTANRLAQVNSKNPDFHRNTPSLPTDDRNDSCGLAGRPFIPIALTGC